jgi:glycosyltransferase involved in cell wall biosynthesis
LRPEHCAYNAAPTKLFENRAGGRPIGATDLPATAYRGRDGDTALLVPPSDPPALAAALARLHGDPGLCARLGENARRLVFERYTWEARAWAILDFISRRLEAK